MFGIHCIEMGLQPTKNWAAVFARIAETFGVVIFYLFPHLQIFLRVLKLKLQNSVVCLSHRLCYVTRKSSVTRIDAGCLTNTCFENPCVGGSIPPRATKNHNSPLVGLFSFGLADKIPLARITRLLKLTNEINQGYSF